MQLAAELLSVEKDERCNKRHKKIVHSTGNWEISFLLFSAILIAAAKSLACKALLLRRQLAVLYQNSTVARKPASIFFKKVAPNFQIELHNGSTGSLRHSGVKLV